MITITARAPPLRKTQKKGHHMSLKTKNNIIYYKVVQYVYINAKFII